MMELSYENTIYLSFIIDVWQGSKYTSAYYRHELH